jgi:hypothetical protein
MDGNLPPTVSPRPAVNIDTDDVAGTYIAPPRTGIAAIKDLKKYQPWMDFIQLPVFDGEESLGLRNSDETRLFEEADDKRLGG